MWRRACLLGVCLVLLVGGCKRKQPEPEGPGAREPEVVAPPGLAHVPGTKPPVFITRSPLTVGEYLLYVEATGEPLPEPLAAEGVAETDPVMGLSLAQAKRFATWQMMRLPTASEWRQAARIVGAGPYPWGAQRGENEPRGDARLFLVRAWAEGSAEQRAAAEAKEELAEELLTQRRGEISAALDRLHESAAQAVERLGAKWREVKPALFERARKGKEYADAAARRRGMKTALDYVQRVGQRKAELINLKYSEGVTPDAMKEGIEKYKAFLAEQRNEVQALLDELLQASQEASRQATALAQQLEQAGDALTAGPSAVAAGEREETVRQVRSLADAVRERDRIASMLKEVEATEAEVTAFLEGLQADLTAQTEELETRLASLGDPDETAAQIEDLQARIQGLNENLREEFAQEPHIFNALEQLTEVSARKKGIEREVNDLKEILAAFRALEPQEGGEEGAPEGPGAPE